MSSPDTPSPELEPSPEYLPIKKAVISVSDKEGLVDFAQGLIDEGVEIISTGGTLRELRGEGVPATPIEEYTGFPEILGGRVKTLQARIHAELLADGRNPEHMATLHDLDFEAIDLVAVNLYPFEKKVAEGVEFEEAVENIDIGGPTLLRGGGKNWESTVAVVNPKRYSAILEEIREHGGVARQTRYDCFQEVFQHTAAYDGRISEWANDQELPPSRLLASEELGQDAPPSQDDAES